MALEDCQWLQRVEEKETLWMGQFSSESVEFFYFAWSSGPAVRDGCVVVGCVVDMYTLSQYVDLFLRQCA
mgnify:FL=1